MENVGKKKLDMQKLLAPAALVILYIVFSIFGNNFLTLDTVKNILESSYYIGFMAFGVTFIIITGGIDLSLGTVMMCAALLGGYAFKQGWPLVLAIVLTLFVGIAFGFANGVLIAKLKLPPFIATLGTQMMAAGLGSIITKVQSQTWPTATAEVGGWFKKVFIRAELFGVRGFPVGAFWLLGFFIIAALILHKTKFGRYVYTTITPGTGNGQEMNGITGVIIGGTSMSGGSGTMVGTLIGVFIMSVLKTGLANCGLQAPWQTFLTGAVVIGAVLLDIARTKAANRVKKG